MIQTTIRALDVNLELQSKYLQRQTNLVSVLLAAIVHIPNYGLKNCIMRLFVLYFCFLSSVMLSAQSFETNRVASELIAVKNARGKWGFIDRTGKVVIPCKWELVYDFCEGLAAVKDEKGNYGFINKKGNLVIPCKWWYTYRFQEGLAMVMKNFDSKGFIDETGNLVIPCNWKDADSFYGDYAAVKDDNDRWGFIDKTGKVVIPCKWYNARHFSGDLAPVKGENSKWGYIDKTGNVVIPCKWSWTWGFFDGLALVKDSNGKKYYIDKNGDVVLQSEMKESFHFSEGLTQILDENGKWGFMDKGGNIVIPCKWKHADSFSEGFAVVENDKGKYGYIDKTGNIVIPCKWKFADSFRGGLAEVTNNGKDGMIDKSGNIVIPCEWKGIRYSYELKSATNLLVNQDISGYSNLNVNNKEVPILHEQTSTTSEITNKHNSQQQIDDKENAQQQDTQSIDNSLLPRESSGTYYQEPSVSEKKESFAQNHESMINLDSCIVIYNKATTKDDFKEAFKGFQDLAEHNNPYAQLFTGWCYEKGMGVDVNIGSAIKWYNKAAAQGNADACFRIALFFINGIRVRQSEEEALQWYKKGQYLEDLSTPNHMEYSLEDLTISNKEEMLNHEVLRRLFYSIEGSEWEPTDDGFKEHNMCVLASYYEKGIGGCTTTNFERAFYWYEKAQQNPKASQLGHIYYRLGYLNYKGLGTKQDYKKAVSWIKQGALHHAPSCLILLGWMYEKGIGVVSDHQIAEKYYYQAKNLEKYNLEDILSFGTIEEFLSSETDLEDSWEKALYWGEIADNKKFASLANIVVLDKDTKSDYLKEDTVNLQIGLDFLNKKEYRRAAHHFHLAAGNNNPLAQYYMATLYEKGLGVRRNMKVAYDWYNAANRFNLYNLGNKIDSLKPIADVSEYEDYSVSNNYTTEKKRIALVIGNANYASQRLEPLNSPLKDARDIRERLEKLGFQVMPPIENASESAMRKAIKDFVNKAENYDVALFYYSGHGIQGKQGIGATNYLIPTNAKLEYRENLVGECIDLNEMVIDNLHKKCKASLVFIDACRTVLNLPSKNDIGNAKGFGNEIKGLNEQMPPKGVCVVYATSAGDVAYDPRHQNTNSFFTQGLLDCLDKDKDKSLPEFIQLLRERVYEKTNGKQIPAPYNELFGSFYFDPNK